MPTNDSSSRDRILTYLDSQGGSIANEEGRGLTQALASAAGYADLSVLNGMLSRLEREGVITREVRGRRTYRIALAKGGRSSTNGKPAPAPRRAPTKAAGTKRAPAQRTPRPQPADDSRLNHTEALLAQLRDEVSTLRRRLEGVEANVTDLARLAAKVEEMASPASAPPATAPAAPASERKRGLFGRR